jgi:glycosyltransferase involved in cell wall biosynthesis
MPEFLALSDASMVLLKRSDLFKTVIPSKIFEAMSMERPVILGVQGECEEIIRQAECGICIEPENAEALADAVVKLQADRQLSRRLGENGRRCVVQNYSRDVLATRYINILSSLGGSN